MTGKSPQSSRYRARLHKERAIEGTWEDTFLTALALHPVISKACEVANVDRRTVFARRKSDSEFNEAFETAWEAGIDRVESTLIKRAEGIEQDVFDKNGEHKGTRKEYSDYAAAKFLEARRPDFYYRPRKEVIREGEDPAAAMARAVCAAIAAASGSVPKVEEERQEGT